MADMISSTLNSYPECRDAIGQLVLGYSHLEVFQLRLVTEALNVDMSTAGRLLYSARSEAQRLTIADVTARPFFIKHGLGNEFKIWLGAMRHCKSIRNQYAHSVWVDRKGVLSFADLDHAAKSREGEVAIEYYPVDLDLLERQMTFFKYTQDCAFFLRREAMRLRDGRRKHQLAMPKASPRPRLHNRPG